MKEEKCHFSVIDSQELLQTDIYISFECVWVL